MDLSFRRYQTEALATDQVPAPALGATPESDRSLIVPLLGLAGEVGSLVTEYKKRLREGVAYTVFKERLEEEIGDVLWYLSNVSTKAGLDLETIASRNLRKTQNRWRSAAEGSPAGARMFDEGFPASQQLPREFVAEFEEVWVGDRVKVQVKVNGDIYGDSLTDNAYEDDAYRFHDVFHFSYAVLLGWSPIMRRAMRLKRKQDPQIDEVEDGARAAILEEAISAIVFDYAKSHSFLDGVETVTYDLLSMIRSLTANLEVGRMSLSQWEHAIVTGYRVWRQVRDARGGQVIGDLNRRRFEFVAAGRTAATPTT